MANMAEGGVRTNVYIDGFNLYYRALKGSGYKWLDVFALSTASLPRSCAIQTVNYYTAHVSGRLDPDAPRRQHAYIRALQTIPNIRVHHGNHIVTEKWAGLVQPARFKPDAPEPWWHWFSRLFGFVPQVAYIRKTEEKGSDVKLGVHLVRDAYTAAFDHAAILTNDTDLVEPIRIVTRDLRLPVTLLTPVAKPATSLVRVATGVRHISPYLGPCQLPEFIPVPNKKPIRKPAGW